MAKKSSGLWWALGLGAVGLAGVGVYLATRDDDEADGSAAAQDQPPCEQVTTGEYRGIQYAIERCGSESPFFAGIVLLPMQAPTRSDTNDRVGGGGKRFATQGEAEAWVRAWVDAKLGPAAFEPGPVCERLVELLREAGAPITDAELDECIAQAAVDPEFQAKAKCIMDSATAQDLLTCPLDGS